MTSVSAGHIIQTPTQPVGSGHSGNRTRDLLTRSRALYRRATAPPSNGREREEFTRTCNCRDKTLCRLKGKCLQEGVVYKVIVTQTESIKQDIYIGRTENPFKTRYKVHNSSFRLPHKRSKATLSEHLWTLKDAGVICKTQWTILDKAKPCSPAARKNITYY